MRTSITRAIEDIARKGGRVKLQEDHRFFLEVPDEYAHANLTRVDHSDLLPDFLRQDQSAKYMYLYYREYCWIAAGEIIEDEQRRKVLSIRGPQSVLSFGYSTFRLNNWFEVEGPSRKISIKEYVQLYDESRAQRNFAPFQWHENVFACIRTLDEYKKQEER